MNEQYQSVFPGDVNAVFDHGKRDVSRYPIATGTYYKMDYSAGVDISRYKNIPVPTSYMAIRSKYNLSVAMKMIPMPVSCMLPTTMSLRAKSNGPGEMAISGRPGIAI